MEPPELKAYRKKKKMTQAEAAKWLEVSKSTVVSWETGRNPIPPWVSRRIEGEGLKLNPKLSYEVFVKAQEKAESEGKSFEQWVADLINKAIILALVGGALWLFV